MPILIDPHKSINSVNGHGYKQLKSSANMIKTEQDVCKNDLHYNNNGWRRRKTDPCFMNLDHQSSTYSESRNFKAL